MGDAGPASPFFVRRERYGSGHPHHPAHSGAVCPHRPAVPARLWLAARRAGKGLSPLGEPRSPGGRVRRPGVEGLYPGPGAAGVPVRGQYINLAEQGYDGYVENGQHLFLVFYPAYVWLLRAARVLIPHTLLAGMLLSSLCYAGGCCFVYRLARLFYPHAVARDGVLFLSLFPFSFFFGAAMTEGLFLLSTGAAVYYACRGKCLPFWLWGA